jgi:hypothetical protein
MRMGSNKIYAVFLTVIAALCLNACAGTFAGDGQDRTPTQEYDCQNPTDWKITFVRSGGFAGQTSIMDIYDSGELTLLTDGQDPETRTTLAEADLVRIEELFSPLCTDNKVGSYPPCPDCFNYSLTVEMDGRVHRAEANDSTLNKSFARPLIELLITVLNQTMQAQP